MLKDELYNFIARHKLAVLATAAADGKPQAALVGIAVTPELELVFDTVRSTRKARNLSENPAAAFVIGCTDETTCQYEGVAQELGGDDLAKYKQIYFAAFPDGPAREAWAGITYYVVRPRWIRFSDFTQPPPRIEELRWPGPQVTPETSAEADAAG
jgi:pyridoxine/pyridoxamine 5'-phosphate oxidase